MAGEAVEVEVVEVVEMLVNVVPVEVEEVVRQVVVDVEIEVEEIDEECGPGGGEGNEGGS